MSRHRAAPSSASKHGGKISLALIAGSGVLLQFLNLAAGVMAARMLGVEGRGQLVLVSVLAQMSSQLTLGGSLPNAITKELASHGVKARDGLRGMVLRWTAWGSLGALAASVYFVVANDQGLTPTVVALAVGTALMAMLSMTSRILIGSMLGEHANPLTIAMTGLLPQLVGTIVMAIGLGVGADWGVVEIIGIMIACQGIVLATRLRGLAAPSGRAEDRLDRRELVRIARRSHIGSIGPLDGLALDRALVGSLIGSAALGLYSSAVALGSLCMVLGTTVAMVALPKIAAAQRGDRDAERLLVRRWILISVVIMVPTVAVFELANPFIIPLLFGEEFEGAVECGYWYVAASGFLAVRRILIVTLQGRGRGATASWIELALTPFVALAVFIASLTDDVATIGMGMLGVGIASCAALAIAVVRLEPVPFVERAEDDTVDGARPAPLDA